MSWKKPSPNRRWAKVPPAFMESQIWASIPPAEAKVIVCLAKFMNVRSGLCFPGLKKLRALSGFTSRHLNRVLKSLKKQGYVTVIKGGGRHNLTHYHWGVVLHQFPPSERGRHPHPPKPKQGQDYPSLQRETGIVLSRNRDSPVPVISEKTPKFHRQNASRDDWVTDKEQQNQGNIVRLHSQEQDTAKREKSAQCKESQ